MTVGQARELIAEAVGHWNEDKVPRLAAAISFYAVLALAPLLVIAVAATSFMLDEASIQARVAQSVRDVVGSQASELVHELIEKSAEPATGILATIISLIVAVYAASNLFMQLSETVNHLWGIPTPEMSLQSFVRMRFWSLVLLLAFALVVIAWLAFDSWLGWVGRRSIAFPGWRWLSQIVSIAFLTIIFGLSYRTLPRGMVRLGDVWFGALLAATGFTLTKYLLSLYFAYSGVSAAYGSAGALVVILLWVYYTTMIYFFGIEMVYTYAHRFGSQRERRPGAPPLVSDPEALKPGEQPGTP